MPKMLIVLSGVAHLALGVGSLLIPKLLNWKGALAAMPTLIRQMFWSYAGYILGINIFFGLVSIFLADELLSGSGLANALLALITLYWLVRLIIQFTYFDRTAIPRRGIYLAGEIGLNILFVWFAILYGTALWMSL
jgi:hypothetical protein